MPLGRVSNGDQLPEMRVAPPGPKSRASSKRLETFEAAGINTLFLGQPAIVWQEAVGANVLDVDGNCYVDLTAGFGVAALGHRNPSITAAIHAQSASLTHGLADVHAHPKRIDLAERLCQLTGPPTGPFAQPQVYFAVSGADAVEISLKTAQLATGRKHLVAFEPSYHGTTLGALEATSRTAFRTPFVHRLGKLFDRLPFGCTSKQIRRSLKNQEVAAVIVEPIVGREGVVLPPPGWLAALSSECKAHGSLLIVDEIFTGFGRTGRVFASSDEPGLEPDLLCCGKALGGGLPIGAVIGEKATMAAWQTNGEALHTGTFVAHPLACAAGLAFLKELSQTQAEVRAAELGALVGARLATWQKHATVRETRGRGLLWGVEFETSRAAKNLAQGGLERGVLVLAGGSDGRVVQICPPLTISLEQMNAALGLLEGVLFRG